MTNSLMNILAAFQHGGIWMWAIFFCQMISIAIIVERVYALYIQRRPNQLQLASQFESDIKAGKIDRAISKAKVMSSQNPLGTATLAGAQSAMNMGGKEEIQVKMDEVLIDHNQKLEKRTGFLSMIGNVATLLGLLGTIVGMIEAFSSLSAASAAERSALLAKGISMAMYATAYGLIVAVPALVAYAILQSRSQTLVEDLNQAALKVYIWLSYSYESIKSNERGTK